MYGLAAGVGLAVLSAPRSGRASTRVTVAKSSRAELQRLAKATEQWAGMPGFAAFADAVARRESKWNNLAVNPGDAKFACNGWKNQKDKKFKDNPFGATYWCWGSGGWFGFIPSTALASPSFRNANPMLVHDPAHSVVFFADFVRRLEGMMKELPPEQRNLLAVRRAMAGLTVFYDWREEKVLKSDKDGIPRARKVRERLAADLIAAGYDPDVMYYPATWSRWPGDLQLYGWLRQLDQAEATAARTAA